MKERENSTVGSGDALYFPFISNLSLYLLVPRRVMYRQFQNSLYHKRTCAMELISLGTL